MKKYFTNSIFIKADPVVVEQLLLNIGQLQQWNPGIFRIENSTVNSFEIYRTEDAFNTYEKILIEHNTDKIIYHSRDGRLEYDLVFKLSKISNQTKIEETFFTYEDKNIKLPLKLIQPIAKQAFNQNLSVLKNLSESIHSH